MRVYVPATLTGLAALHSDGKLSSVAGYAVTDGLREWAGTEDPEELEYVALSEAARDSLELLGGEPDPAPRRVVIVVEMPDTVVEADPDGGHGAVLITAEVPLKKVDSVQADDDAAADDIKKALGGDPAAEDAVDDRELLWFATQEIPFLVG
jgi:hypothetical protein